MKTTDELTAHVGRGDGFIFNVDGRKLHHVSCQSVRGMALGTGKYALDAGEDVAAFLAMRGGTACPSCLPGFAANGGDAGPASSPRADRSSAMASSPVCETPARDGVPNGVGHVEFAVAERTVRAWSTEYVPLSPKTPTSHALKAGLCAALTALVPVDGEILHAVFGGAKPPAADIENLLLYNLGARAVGDAGAHGMCLECDLEPPTSPLSGATFSYAFAYELIDAEAPWGFWTRGRELVRWRHVSLGTFAGEKKLEQVWAALSGAALTASGPPRAPGELYTIALELHPPVGAAAHPVRLIKSAVDGAVSAFQAHTDSAHRGEVARRISGDLGVSAEQVEAWLADESCAVLGSFPTIVHQRADGVQWAPADSDLVVVDLRPALAIGSHWAISGRVHVAERALAAT